MVGRFVDSKLKEDWVELDWLGLYQRLGHHSDLVVGGYELQIPAVTA